LDFTYLNAEIPHHVSDECLSELAVCNYKARRLPLLLLRRIVRSVYEPNEYPSSMQRLYQWTPDECIPEFYSDPDVFRSIHTGMCDLAVPPWSQNADDFIQLHRAALESDRVSQQLHHWIDITFGCMLSGQAAVDAKNVTLSSSPSVPRCSGRRQLFQLPHPRRREQHISSSKPESETDKKNHKPVNESDSAFKSGVRNRCYSLDGNALEDCSSSWVFRTILNERGVLERASNHLKQVAPLEELIESNLFAEKARHLSSCYAALPVERGKCGLSKARSEHVTNSLSRVSPLGLPNKDECAYWESSPLYKAHILASINSKDSFRLADDLKDAGNEDDGKPEDLVWWEALRQQGTPCSEAEGRDVFAAACIIAEMYLRRPLFDPISMAAYEASGVLPDILNQLPPFVVSLIKPALHPAFQQ
jgi:WD repeat-containing protein 81